MDKGRSPYTISINKDGQWFYNENEIIHPRILRIFWRGLRLGEDGGYYLEVDGDTARVEVEDAPFLVISVTLIKEDEEDEEDDIPPGFLLTLSDETQEILDIETLRINERNIPYSRVKGGLLARFSSKAYYMLADYIEFDEGEDSYYIKTKSGKYVIPYRGGSH